MEFNSMPKAQKKLIVAGCLLVIAVFIGISMHSKEVSPPHDIDTLIESQSIALHLPGLAVGIVKDNEVVYANGISYDGIVKSDSPFIIGSLSKAYTGTAIMQLSEKGDLELSDSVQKYVPEFDIKGYDSSKITIKHLLNHTSGISTLSGEDSYEENISIEEAVHLLNTHKLVHEPGSKFEYSNANYRVLGLIIERITNKSYADYIEDNIFAPLNSKCSYTSYETAKQNGLITGYKTVFGFNIQIKEPFVKAALPSGFLISCVDDINKFILANVQRDPILLKPESYEKLYSESVKISGNRSYGAGWYTAQIDDFTVHRHSGDTLTYHASFFLVPERKSGFVLLTNTNSLFQGSFVDERIGNNIVNLLLNKEVNVSGINLSLIYTAAFFAFIGIFGLLAFQIRSVFKRKPLTTASRASSKRLILSICVDFMIGLALLLFVPRLIGTNVNIIRMFKIQPDLTLLLVAGICTSLAAGFIKLANFLMTSFSSKGRMR